MLDFIGFGGIADQPTSDGTAENAMDGTKQEEDAQLSVEKSEEVSPSPVLDGDEQEEQEGENN